MSSKVSFSIADPEFDKTTYWGRFESIRASNNPLFGLYTNKQILEMQKLIQAQKATEQQQLKEHGDAHVMMAPEEIKKLRTAEYVVNCAIHPDTGKLIPWPMRLSSYIHLNIPITFGLLIAAPTPFNTVFWQWANQSVNAGLNYGNRNASSTYTTKDVAKGYALASVASIVVALGIRKGFSSLTKNMTGSKVIIGNSFSSAAACGIAGFLNAYIMRASEFESGIDISDPA